MMVFGDEKVELMDQFEYPLPVICADVEKIYFETALSYHGKFTLTNKGGGELNGYLICDTDVITFLPTSFSGNNVEINYTFIAEAYKQGEIVTASFVIVSNGGELTIPVTAEIIAPEIYAKDGTRISSLMDYMFYVRQNPVASRQLFMQKEFIMWLMSMNYEHMELYERFVMDANKERAVDNFLILNKLKRRAQLSLVKNEITVRLKPLDIEPVACAMPIKMTGWGYTELSISHSGKSSFLKLVTESVSYSDFDENGNFEASFIVYPALIRKKISFDELVLKGDLNAKLCITIVRETPLRIELSKNCFTMEDFAFLKVYNETERDIKIEVIPRDSFIKFAGKRYFIGKYAEIMFEIKMTGLQAAQFALKKQPYIFTTVVVRSVTEGVRFEHEITIAIGNI